MGRLTLLLSALIGVLLFAVPAGAATDPVVAALRSAPVLVQPGGGTPAQAALLRKEARRLERLGYPTKFALLSGRPPARFIAYSGTVRRGVGARWNVVLVWNIGGRWQGYAFDSPGSAAVADRVDREAARANRDRPGGVARLAIDIASRMSWYQDPVAPPRGGRSVNLDADPELERLVKVPVGIRFPRNSFPGVRYAIVDGGATTRIGTPGERAQAPRLLELIPGGAPALLLGSSSGNASFSPEVVSWDGRSARTLWRPSIDDFDLGDIPANRFIGGYSSLTFPDLEGDGAAEILLEATVVRCRACEPEQLRLATYRYEATSGVYRLEQVQITRT